MGFIQVFEKKNLYSYPKYPGESKRKKKLYYFQSLV